MAKKSRSNSKPTPKAQSKEQQKKQAKKEAKMMLAIEQVKDSLEKAQDKLAMAQARVEARTAHLSNLEAKLAAARSASPAIPVPVDASDSGFDHQGGQSDTQEGETATATTSSTQETPAPLGAASGQASAE